MTREPILREAIQPRLDGIRENLLLLQEFAELPFASFRERAILDRVHHNLRLALEGVFHITSHLLSRIPGARETEYKRMARKLGEVGVVDAAFADTKLVEMDGYRNRLTHFYSEVKAEELYDMCRAHLDDIEAFLHSIKQVMEEPNRFGLIIE